MKTQISASLKLTAAVLFSSLLLTQAKAQCQADWLQYYFWTGNNPPCIVNFLNTSTWTGGTGWGWTSYYWNFGDGQTSNVASPSHTYSVSGTYNVCLTAYFTSTTGASCSDTLCRNVTVQCGTTGVNELSGEESFSVFPNPTSGKFTVIASFAKQSQIEIYNVLGEMVYDNNHFQINSFSNFQIDLSSQPNGIYFLQISALSDTSSGGKTEQGTINQKLIIQK